MRTVRIALLAAAIAVATYCTPTSAVPTKEPPPKRIGIFGDSIAQGQGSTDQEGIRPELSRLLHAADVPHVYTNGGAARGGWLVQDLLREVDSWSVDQPNIVYLMIGTNNAAGACSPVLGCVGMTNFAADYRRLVDKIVAWPSVEKLIVGTVPYSNKPWSPKQVDVNVAVITKGGWHPSGKTVVAYTNRLHPCMLGDGVHPQDAGYLIMARLVAQVLLPALGRPAPAFNEVVTDKRPINGERPSVVGCYL